MNTALLIVTIVIGIIALLLLRKAWKQISLMRKLKYAVTKPEELIKSMKETGKRFFSGEEEIKLDVSKDEKGKPVLIQLNNEQPSKVVKVPAPSIEGKGFPIPIFKTQKLQDQVKKNSHMAEKDRIPSKNQGEKWPKRRNP